MAIVLPQDWIQEFMAVLAKPNMITHIVDVNNRTPLLTKIDLSKTWLSPGDFLVYLRQNPNILAQVIILINESHFNVNKSNSDYIQLYGTVKNGKLVPQANAFGSQVNVYGATPAQLPVQSYGSNVQYYPAPQPTYYPQAPTQQYWAPAPAQQMPIQNTFYGNYPATFTTTTPYSTSTFIPIGAAPAPPVQYQYSTNVPNQNGYYPRQ